MENFTWFEWIIICIIIYAMIHRLRKKDVTYEAKKYNIPVEIRIENIDGCFYLWNKTNNDFLAQGTTFDAAVAVLENRYPETKFVMNKEEYHRSKSNSQEI